MKRPIEKVSGWYLCREDNSKYVYTKETKTLYIYKDGRIETFVNLSGHIDEDVSFTFEELQAIYKTAKQIKENGLNDKTY